MKVNNPLNFIGIHREEGLDVGRLKTGGFVFVAHGEKKRPFTVVLSEEAARRVAQFLTC